MTRPAPGSSVPRSERKTPPRPLDLETAIRVQRCPTCRAPVAVLWSGLSCSRECGWWFCW